MYSLDFRRRVLSIKSAEGLSFAEVANRFKIGIASVVRWSKKIEPSYTRNKPPTKIDMESLKRDIELYPDAYHYERAQRLCVSPKGIFEALKRLGVTYKKTLKHPKADSEKRSIFCQSLKDHEDSG